MNFHATPIAGAFIVEPTRREDIRGSFARLWSASLLAERGLVSTVADINTSRSRRRGTLRGLHHQFAPHEEAKLVRCTRGAIYDVFVDLRPGSPTWLQWAGFELREPIDRMLYIPPGCAHGFQTLEDDSEVIYTASAPYHPELERGIRWNDPAFGIAWPVADVILSDKDRNLPLYAPHAADRIGEWVTP